MCDITGRCFFWGWKLHCMFVQGCMLCVQRRRGREAVDESPRVKGIEGVWLDPYGNGVIIVVPSLTSVKSSQTRIRTARLNWDNIACSQCSRALHSSDSLTPER